MENNTPSSFGKLFAKGQQALNYINQAALTPQQTKILRGWKITEAAEMVGRTTQTLRNLEDAGKIPKAEQMSNGKREYSLSHINLLREHFGTRPHKPENTDPAILGFVNFKGGAGKTTSSIMAAQYLAKKGYRVLFVDCDSQGSATQMFGYIPDENIQEEETLLNVLIDESNSLKPCIKKTYWDGLDLIPANLSLYNAELILPTQISSYAIKTGKSLEFYNRLNSALVKEYEHYDIIILDCPPSMGMISINAIFAANALIIGLPPVIVDFASTVQFFKMVSEVLERLPAKDFSFIRILLTKFNGRKTATQMQELLRSCYSHFVMANNMIESEAISHAATNMQTLYEMDKIYGDKRTYERAMAQADRVNEELENLIRAAWGRNSSPLTEELLQEGVLL